MFKKLSLILAVIMLASMVLSACTAATPTPAAPEPTKAVEPTKAPEATATTAAAASNGKKICEVTDMGGIDDKSFNATAWKGVEDAVKQYGVEGKYLESQQQTDYDKNVNAFLEEKCDLIVTVGFLLGDATKAAAEKNPNQKFAIVDFTYDPAIANVRGSSFTIDQATFLAGYLAASQTKTGTVGTYGGLQIPPVTAFMDGFYLGVQKYNEVHKTTVKVVGWDPKTQKGSFTGDFNNLDNGKKLTESMLDEGADIIMPVAGPVGGGTLAALKEKQTGLMIGVDTDWSVMYPDDASVILASAMKNMDKWVSDTTKMVLDGSFKGENYVGNLQNNGVGLSVGTAFQSKLSPDLLKEIDALKADIIAGKIATAPTPAK